MSYSEMSREQLLKLRDELAAEYEQKKGLGLDLSMARGKPAKAQLASRRTLSRHSGMLYISASENIEGSISMSQFSSTFEAKSCSSG